MKKFLSALLFSCCALSAGAAPLTLERIYGNSSLAGSTPKHLTLSPDGKRVGFLRGRPDDQYLLDLWEFDVKSGATRRLIDADTLAGATELSDQEKARRERQRTAGLRGILDYSWSPDGRFVLLPQGGDLYLVDLAQPQQARRIASGDVIDARISPRGRYVSYVRGQNLFVYNVRDQSERQLTHDGGGAIHNAEAEFVAQEEMAQSSGYWWAPDDSAIAYKRFDESRVTLARRHEIYADRTEMVEQRYPYAGSANVAVTLALVRPDSGQTRNIALGADPDIYLVRADWSADAAQLLYMRQSRDQKRLDLVGVDVASGAQTTLISETAATWVDIPDAPVFLKKQAAFLWTSERSGARQVYLYDLAGRLLRALSGGERGIEHILAVSEETGQVYVSANHDAATDRQTYALALDGSSAARPRRLTGADGWHDTSFSARGEVYIDSWSDQDHPPQVSLHRADGSRIAWIAHNPLDAAHPYAPYLDSHVPTEYGTLTAADGQILHYSLKKPLNFVAGKRYPVFVQVYGGPGAQTVQRRWGSLFDQYMAQQGYVVFRLDNRGSSRRERRFTDAIYRNLGKNEVADQLTGIDWLARQGFVDPGRIGVFGWSYGGFMSLRLLSAASERIAAGVAVAPVTDWALYDTHYVEQFLDQPQDNPDGYRASSVFTHLDGLRSPLLLVHGMADDNVLFSNSTRLIDELSNRGILFDFMAYPGAKHGISGSAKQQHVYKTIAAFFARHLHPEKPL